MIFFVIIGESLRVSCGNRQAEGRHIHVNVPSLAALSAFQSINAAPPIDPAKFALRMLNIFFSLEELAGSNCTKAEGRNLLDPNILLAIKRKRIIFELIFWFSSAFVRSNEYEVPDSKGRGRGKVAKDSSEKPEC